MKSVRISLKTARRILTGEGADYAAAIKELHRAIQPKKSVTFARVRKEAKKKTKKEATSSVRAQVAKRAGELCECGCGIEFTEFNRAEFDHFMGKARSEKVETCWMLRRDCHRAKTVGVPSRDYWLRKFIRHCERHGYENAAREVAKEIESEALIVEAAALSRGAQNV